MKSLLSLATFFSLLFTVNSVSSADNEGINWQTTFAQLEKEYGGRLGIAAYDLQHQFQLHYRGNERFALCSTLKGLLVANVLHRIDQHQESLSRPIHYDRADILDYAPVTKTHLDEGVMSVAALSQATLQLSDNTAANLLLKTIGGPEALTDYLRSIGDNTTRLDRIEPALNSNLAGDLRDTTTPAAMLATLNTLLLGDHLSDVSKQRLIQWLIGNQTGDDKIRAGVPSTWLVGDKTGSGPNGAFNDVAIIWPETGKPYLLVIYYSESMLTKQKKAELLAKISESVSKIVFPGLNR